MAIKKVTIYNGSTSLGDATIVNGNWTKDIDTTAFADGTLTLTAVAIDEANNETRVNRTFIVSNTAPPTTGTGSGALPQALGSLSARQTWTTNFKSMFGAAHDPITTAGDIPVKAPTKTVILNNLPTYTGNGSGGTDFERRWMYYFGNRVGYAGTWAAGDRVVITGLNQVDALNLDIPGSVNNVEIVLGTSTAPAVIQYRHKNSSTGLMDNHAIRILGNNSTEAGSAGNITIRSASKDYPAVLETLGAVGRTGLNQQGNTMILCDPYTHDIMIQDVVGIGARAAGFFAYRAHRVWYNRVTSTETWADAFHAANGCEDILYTDCTSQRSGDDGIAPVRYSGESDASDSKRIAYVRHRVQTTGHGRGAVTICNSDIYWDQLYVEGSAAGGLLWDREASGATPYKGIYNALAQRVHLKGCNWSEQDHGSLFLNNGTTTETVTGRIESILIEDAKPTRQVIRSIGSGPLQIVIKDSKAVGGPGNATFWGGNNTGINGVGNAASYTTFDPATIRQEVSGADTTPPTLVFLSPGRKATVSGTLTGRPTKTSNGVTTDDLGNTGAYRNTGAIAFYAGHVLGISSAGVEVRIGDRLLGTVAKSSLDQAGRGYLENVDTSLFVNGRAIITISAFSNSGKTSKKLYREITISNTTPGTISGIPTGYNNEAAISTVGSVVTTDKGPQGVVSTGNEDTPTPDTTPPSAPTNLVVNRTSDTGGTASWTASTDNVAVTEYVVSRTSRVSGSVINATVTGTSHTFSSLTSTSAYDVTVVARDAAGNASTAATGALNIFSAVEPTTSATSLMFVDPSTTSTGVAGRANDLTDRKTGKQFTWATSSERPIVRELASGRKTMDFLNGRALLEGSGITNKSAITVTMIMAQKNIVTSLRSGYVTAVPSSANDYDRAAGQWAIGSPAASGETNWQSMSISGTPSTAGTFSGFTRSTGTFAVVQVLISADGVAPVIFVDGVQLTTSMTNPTTGGTLYLDRILIGARWFDSSPKDGQQFELGAMFIHEGRLNQSDRDAIRNWAQPIFGTPPTVNDTTAPSIPTNFSATRTSGTTVTLNWTAATDNIGVTKYEIRRAVQGQNATLIATVAGSATSYNDTGLGSGNGYFYEIRSGDQAGNYSNYVNTNANLFTG